MKLMYTYILYCADDSFYVGVTNNIDRRLAEHQDGINETAYTYSRRPVKLVYFKIFCYPIEAIKYEKQLKGWSRKKKIALIKGDIVELIRLSNEKKNQGDNS